MRRLALVLRRIADRIDPPQNLNYNYNFNFDPTVYSDGKLRANVTYTGLKVVERG